MLHLYRYLGLLVSRCSAATVKHRRTSMLIIQPGSCTVKVSYLTSTHNPISGRHPCRKAAI